MKTPCVAIVHYHLRRGGVTRVIRNAVKALGEQARCVLVCGEAPPEDLPVQAPVIVIDGLGYDDTAHARGAPGLLTRIRDAIRRETGNAPDLWHIHNHALGKNAASTRAAQSLAEQDEPVLFHIHDFAEDGRPANYRHLNKALGGATQWTDTLYPHGPRTHYALLNRRDYLMLEQAGVPKAALHLLPNPVATESSATAESPPQPGPPLWLYPVRAIRRKNIGEYLLWRATDRSDARYAITLPAESARERPAYERWKHFAREQHLRVSFDLGLNEDFHELLQRAHGLITTSIAEGFGLAFLEPWLINRPLFGRDLPEITTEFVEAGVQLDALYPTLTIPRDWIDADELRSAIAVALKQARTAYGKTTGTDDIERAYAAAVKGDRVEFGHLNEPWQEAVIRRVQTDPGTAAELHPKTLHQEITRATRQNNRHAVTAHFGLTAYGEKLIALYTSILNQPVNYTVNASHILNTFTAPDRFSLLRS